MKPLRLAALAAALFLGACSSTPTDAAHGAPSFDEGPGMVGSGNSTSETQDGGNTLGSGNRTTESGDSTGRGGNTLGSGN
jgi:hypothetical protein